MKSSFPLDHTPRLFRKQYRDEVGGYLSSSCCAVSSAPVIAFFAMEDFLEDIGTEVEINPTINTNFCQCIYVITCRFRSRDYHVTFPGVFPIGLWGVRYSLFIIYSWYYVY